MSGICGVLALGEPPSLGPILEVLKRRGPDGTRAWTGGPAALGHTLLATTPEALVEVLPLTDGDSGCTITTDARIDNRNELLAEFGLAGEARIVGDGELILAAYGKWGVDCPTHLLGDFAFAIWDAKRHRLFCARDHFGMRPLYIAHPPGGAFLFASESEAILALGTVPRRIDEGRIADYLTDKEGRDLCSTFHKGISRLPAAHCLTLEGGEVFIRRYWHLEPGEPFSAQSDDDYAAGFRDVFTEAVRCRLRSNGPVGAMLSGGMDSGSVAAVATRLLAQDGRGPLHTFSAVGPDPSACVETKAIHAALALSGIAPRLVDHTDLNACRADLLRLTEHFGEPFDDHMTLVRAVYLTAHRAGIKVVLDGVMGDVVLGASNRIAAYLGKGRLIAGWREALAEEQFYKRKRHALSAFAAGAWVAFVPAGMRRVRQAMLARLDDILPIRQGPIARKFARRVGLPARARQMRRHLSAHDLKDSQIRARAMRHPHQVAARERYDRTASALAIEPRDPFLDLRVIRYCLSLPPDQLQKEGWPKIVLRRAMANDLPEEILWRKGKEHLGWIFTQSLIRHGPRWKDRLSAAAPLLDGLVAPAILRQMQDKSWPETGDETMLNLFYLARWLARNGKESHRSGHI